MARPAPTPAPPPAPLKGLACVLRTLRRVEVDTLTFMPPGPGYVRLRVLACGLCQSDVSVVSGKVPFPLPCVLGHEGAGVVESVGPGVQGWKAGDRAVLNLVQPCQRCDNCSAGRPSLCTGHRRYWPEPGILVDGAGQSFSAFLSIGCMAEYAVVPRSALVKVKADVPLEKAALVSCGVLAGTGAVLNRAKLHPGSSCCVFGCGGVGLSAIQGCRIAGAAQIIAVDTVASKLEAARRFGATDLVIAKEATDVPDAINKLSKGGADYAFEAIGFPRTAEQAYKAVKAGGTTVMVGVCSPEETMTINVNSLVLGEKVLMGSFMGSAVPGIDVPMLLKLYSKGDLLLDEMLSKYYLLPDVQTMFDDLAAGDNLRGVVVMHDLTHLASQGASKL